MFFENEQLKQQDYNPRQEHENGYPVDPMHISHPLRVWRIRIPFFDIEVFGDLSSDSHRAKLL
jgi:hypothetical protein